jgi:protein-S-isoprenylcysteine O-methyltransferase Ste14
MDIQHRFNRWFKPRFAVVYPFAIAMFVFATCDEHTIRNGIGYVIAGIMVRLWSNGYAIKNDKLTTSGPYAFVRNPLYLGSFLIAVGFALVLKIDALGPYDMVFDIVFILAMAYMYYQTIQKEQELLLGKFGEAFRKYLNRVPAMIPTLNPYAEGEKWPFSLKRLIDSKEHKIFFWMIIILILIHLKSRLLVEHKPATEKTWILVSIVAVLILLDILYEFNKKKIHQKR